MSKQTAEEQRNKQAYDLAIKHYWQTWRANWVYGLSALLFAGIGTVLIFYVPPLIIANLIDKYQNQSIQEVMELWPYLLLFGGVWIGGEMFWRIGIHLDTICATRGLNLLGNRAMNYLLDKDLAFFHDNFAGSLTKRSMSYPYRYVEVTDLFLYLIAPSFVSTVFASFILWRYSPWIVFALIGMMVITVFMILPLLKRRRKLVSAREIAHNSVTGHVADIYTNIDVVRAFANEKYEQNNHTKQVQDYVGKVRRSWDYQNQRIDVVIAPMFMLTNLLGFALVLILVGKTAASISAVVVVYAYFTGLTRFMWEFNNIYKNFEAAVSDAAQFTELLLEDSSVVDVQSPNKFVADEGSIVFNNVDFHYTDNVNQELFENFNLTIKPGEKIGLVGHSGGGKTTLTKLLLRFMDIDSGAILIDGQDISKVRQEGLRKYIAYVPQDPYMFHRSITDNIRYGKLDADESDIKKVAKLSHSAEFIDNLPKKYDTLIGERGVKLSGGQRQRIAVARAMIKDAPILLLDEATSALDSESEKLIQDALWKLMEGRTTIVIAHRLSTIQKMDRILVLENGKIAEQGSHKQLLKNNGVYSDLWQHQSGGFLED
mgnify:FL=1